MSSGSPALRLRSRFGEGPELVIYVMQLLLKACLDNHVDLLPSFTKQEILSLDLFLHGHECYQILADGQSSYVPFALTWHCAVLTRISVSIGLNPWPDVP